MARPLRVEFPGAFYLVTARALSRNRLYRDVAEAEDFLARLPALHEGFGVRCHGYCLLPNHYHLLLETPRANLSRPLHRLNAGFTATTNARRRRKGPLLQSRYRALVIEEEPWLLRLSLHLHLNPVRRKLVARPELYPWSSAAAFLGGGEAPGPWLDSTRVLAQAGGRQAYGELLAEGVCTPPPSPWRHVWRQAVLGGEELRQRVLDHVAQRDPREIPGFTAASPEGLTLTAVVATVAEFTGVPVESVYRGKFQRVLARKLALYLARRYTGLTLREIGAAFGVDYTTVHMAARRVEEQRRTDEGVDELLCGIETDLRVRAKDQGGSAPAPSVDVAAVLAPPSPPPAAPEPARSPDVPVPTAEKTPRARRKRQPKDASPQLKLF